MEDGYPFVFLMNDYSDHSNGMKYCMQYHFRSTKSNHTYIVRLEKYEQNAYCVKFYDKAVSDSKNKYSLRNNTFEPRTILYTIINIMMDVHAKDPKASFFFVGAEDERDEGAVSTRRYSLYRKFTASAIGNMVFDHFRVNRLSLYILVNKTYVSDTYAFAKNIEQKVSELY